MSRSEAEDDPESYESSENEWEEAEQKKTTRRRTTRKATTKKPKKSQEVEEEEEDDSSEDDSESDASSPVKSKNGVAAKKKKAPAAKGNAKAGAKKGGNKGTQSKKYAVGSFVIAKEDAKAAEPDKHPLIWRIDGKSLLQKYEAFEEDGKLRYKSTSVYTGWSPMDTDEYAPLKVDVIEQSEGHAVVELLPDELKKVIEHESE